MGERKAHHPCDELVTDTPKHPFTDRTTVNVDVVLKSTVDEDKNEEGE